MRIGFFLQLNILEPALCHIISFMLFVRILFILSLPNKLQNRSVLFHSKPKIKIIKFMIIDIFTELQHQSHPPPYQGISEEKPYRLRSKKEPREKIASSELRGCPSIGKTRRKR